MNESGWMTGSPPLKSGDEWIIETHKEAVHRVKLHVGGLVFVVAGKDVFHSILHPDAISRFRPYEPPPKPPSMIAAAAQVVEVMFILAEELQSVKVTSVPSLALPTTPAPP